MRYPLTQSVERKRLDVVSYHSVRKCKDSFDVHMNTQTILTFSDSVLVPYGKSGSLRRPMNTLIAPGKPTACPSHLQKYLMARGRLELHGKCDILETREDTGGCGGGGVTIRREEISCDTLCL